MTSGQKRQPKGIPTGGEFATNTHGDAEGALGSDSLGHRVLQSIREGDQKSFEEIIGAPLDSEVGRVISETYADAHAGQDFDEQQFAETVTEIIEARREPEPSPYPEGYDTGGMEVGDVRGAITSDEYTPFGKASLRFPEGRDREVILPATTARASWDDPTDRAVYLAQSSHVTASVERVRDYDDWLRRRKLPHYVVTLGYSRKNEVTGEYEPSSIEVDLPGYRRVPSRADAVTHMVEIAQLVDVEYPDEESYVISSGKEYEDAASEYARYVEQRDDLRDFLGEENYQAWVHGKTPGVTYIVEGEA